VKGLTFITINGLCCFCICIKHQLFADAALRLGGSPELDGHAALTARTVQLITRLQACNKVHTSTQCIVTPLA
jgi:hypothetical protein